VFADLALHLGSPLLSWSPMRHAATPLLPNFSSEPNQNARKALAPGVAHLTSRLQRYRTSPHVTVRQLLILSAFATSPYTLHRDCRQRQQPLPEDVALRPGGEVSVLLPCYQRRPTWQARLKGEYRHTPIVERHVIRHRTR